MRNKGNLNLRAGRDDLGGSFIRVLLVVFVEQLSKLGDFSGEVSLAGPRLGGVEKIVWDAGARLGDLKVEDAVVLVLGLSELTRVDGVEDGTSVLQRATLATGGGTGTDPTGVEQPSVGIVGGDLLRKHLGVAHGMKGEERLSEAGGEGCLRFRNTLFGTSHL